MNHPLRDSGCLSSLALCALVLALGCSQTDSIGNGGRHDGAADVAVADVPPQTPGTGGAAGLGASGAVGGSAGTGGTAGRSGTGVGGATGGVTGTGGATGSGGVFGTGGSGGLGAAGGSGGSTTGVDAADASVDAPASDASADGVTCSGPNPASVTCLTNKDQCVPSTCYCSSEGIWGCSTDCRGNLALCDAGVGPDGKQDAAGPDAAPDVVAPEAPAPASYTCRNDTDCCIVVDTCINHAYLYSRAPGATGLPSLPPPPSCNRCVPPAVQVRCDLGQCVGEEIPGDFRLTDPILQDHCGPVALPDAGTASPYQPAYGGAQPISWGC